MKCPRCGGEVSQEEAFCGQCGAPNTQSAPAVNPAETMSAPPPHSGFLGTPQMPFSPVPSSPYSMPQMPTASIPPTSASQPLAGPQQQGGFYKDATEAITRLPTPASPSFPTAYPPSQSFPGAAVPPGYQGNSQYHAGPVQPYQPAGAAYPQQFPARPGYPPRPNPAPVPPPLPGKQQNNTGIIIACVVLAIVLIAGIGAGATYLLRSHQNYNRPPDVLAGTTPTPTMQPTPSPTATATPSPQPSPSPTATLAPTPTPDANFSWCTGACTDNGFMTEYPNGWQLGVPSNAAAGVQFTSPLEQDIYAAFKANGPTGSTASDLVSLDLQYFASQPGAATPTPTAAGPTTTISGETWASGMIYYMLNGQTRERVQVYATVHQGKAYIIELEAPDSQYDATNNQYFVTMIGKFQFQQGTQ